MIAVDDRLEKICFIFFFFFVNFSDGNWRQAESRNLLLAGVVEVKALAQ